MLIKGNMAVIGRKAAVAQIGRLHLTGWFAWLMWLFVHLMFLVGFENRLLVFVQWAWNYFTRNRRARLILEHILSSAHPPRLPTPSRSDAPLSQPRCRFVLCMPAESAGNCLPIGYCMRGDGDDAMEHSDSVFERAVAVGGLAA
jgi:hypothetical protein